MPEMKFEIRWPDGKQQECYSPSLIIKELFQEQADYPVFEFVERSRAALNIAAERVRLKYGHYCSAAADQLKAIESDAERYQKTDPVRVVAFREK